MSSAPEVSVVIPTFARPDLVTRAVRSALAQTVTEIEVIVVVDGPDQATRDALGEIGDPRVRLVELARKGGAPNARNMGVLAARAPWTALLDDDDEWLPEKLAVQLETARTSTVPTPVIASRLINKTPRAEFVMPRRLPMAGEPVCEYLTVRRGLFHGDGFIQTSTIMAPTSLLRRVPFTVGLRRQQELDWTLRALDHDDVDLVIAAEPLVLWHQDEDRPRISLNSPWQAQLEWLRGIRPLLTPKAYAAIVMSIISSMAAPTRSFRVFRMLLGEARRHGRPSAIDYLTFLQIWLIPPQLRHTLRDRILSRRRQAGQAGDTEPHATEQTFGAAEPAALSSVVAPDEATLPASPAPNPTSRNDVHA
ncbi:glycosyltransferase family 2 protein [Micromonospora sp. NPDC094482]|uniref:glycosyltransferase family 2 protein n=1 Tax=unclassified Micromonospora TaxID=2617518 RepID=UPI003326118B